MVSVKGYCNGWGWVPGIDVYNGDYFGEVSGGRWRGSKRRTFERPTAFCTEEARSRQSRSEPVPEASVNFAQTVRLIRCVTQCQSAA